MFHTNTHPGDPLPKIAERIALPLLLFAAVLCVLLFVSWFGILPRFTRFQVSDSTLSPVEMAAYARQMRAQLTAMETTRDRLVVPETDPIYDTLRIKKESMMSIVDVRATLLQAASQLTNAWDAVRIAHLSLENDTGVVVVAGDVSGVGPRSMTVLAQYVDAVEALPIVTSLQRPQFTRVENTDGSVHSPFSLQFTLRIPQ